MRNEKWAAPNLCAARFFLETNVYNYFNLFHELIIVMLSLVLALRFVSPNRTNFFLHITIIISDYFLPISFLILCTPKIY